MKLASKLKALLKSSEAEEKSALLNLSSIEKVADSRKDKLFELQARYQELAEKINNLATKVRQQSMQVGDVRRAATSASYRKRLEKELEDIENQVSEQSEDVKKAEQRVDLARDELVETQIEKKKVEQLIDRNEKSEEVIRRAREEQLTDDLINRKKPK